MIVFDKYRIVEVKIQDAQKFFELVRNNRENIARYFPHTMKGAKNLNATREMLQYRNKLAKKKIQYHFAITLKCNGQFIGCISLREFNWEILRAEIGFFIDREYEGNGIASKALQAMVKYAFREKKLNKLILRIGTQNTASRRVAEKNNFKLEGVLRKDYKTYYNEIVDIAYYGLLVSDRKKKLQENEFCHI